MSNTIFKLQTMYDYERNNIYRQYVFMYCRIIRDALNSIVSSCELIEYSRLLLVPSQYSCYIQIKYKKGVHPIPNKDIPIYKFEFETSMVTSRDILYKRFAWQDTLPFQERKRNDVNNILSNILCKDLAKLVVKYCDVTSFEHQFIKKLPTIKSTSIEISDDFIDE